MTSLAIPRSFEELTPDYLTEALRDAGRLGDNRVTDVRVEPLGAGLGFVGALARLHLDYALASASAPATLVVKLPGPNRAHRALMELGHGHEREVRFYRELSQRSGIGTAASIRADYDPDPREERRVEDRQRYERLPACLIRCLLPLGLWQAGRSRRRYLVLIEDLRGYTARDQVAGCGAALAPRVAEALADLHAAFWNDPSLAESTWLPPLDGAPRSGRVAYRMGRPRFREECGPALPPHFLQATDWVDAHIDAVLAGLSGTPSTLVHGDFRLDNLLFGPDGTIAAVDWQSAGFGRGVVDWAYFVTGSLAEEVTHEHERELLDHYHAALVSRGVDDYSLERCRREYDLAKLAIAYANVAAAPFLHLEGDRGDALIDRIRARLFDRMPPPPWAGLLRALARPR